eukprot:6184013-Pleurochrysis_carterae.AAC.2
MLRAARTLPRLALCMGHFLSVNWLIRETPRAGCWRRAGLSTALRAGEQAWQARAEHMVRLV